MKKYLFVFLVFALLVGCAPDPRNEADAQRTRLLAAQAALDSAQARTQQQAQFELAQREREQISGQMVASTMQFVRWVWWMATIAVCMGLAGAGFGGGFGLAGLGKAAAKKADLQARLISLDKTTRQYPVLVQPLGHGKYTLTNPNTGQCLQLNIRKEADRQMIASSGAVQVVGMLGYEARMSKNAQGVALVGTTPVVIGAEYAGLLKDTEEE